MARARGNARGVFPSLLLTLACVACLLVGFITFAFGGCHGDNAGWLCDEDYTAENTLAYGLAACFVGLGLVCATALNTRRRPLVALAFPVGVVLVVLAALVTEASN